MAALDLRASSMTFFGKTFALRTAMSPAMVASTSSFKPFPVSASASERPLSATAQVVEPPAVQVATGRLDGKDPAWKMGTAEKSRLKAYYETAVVPAMKAEFGYQNPLEVPQIEKVVINCGIGDASQSSKALEAATKDLATITGQRPVITRSRKAIAGFKLREGVPVGMAATLRGQVMYSYLDRLLNLALPRVRDFRGLSKGGFDGRGNYSMGLAEQTMYPEIQFDQIDQTRGMDISVVTTAKTDNEAQRLLELLGMPFQEGPAPVKEARSKVGNRRGGGGKGGKGGKQVTKSKKKK